MNGLITNPFVEGVALLVLGLLFEVVGHVTADASLTTAANVIIGSGGTYLALAQANKGAK